MKPSKSTSFNSQNSKTSASDNHHQQKRWFSYHSSSFRWFVRICVIVCLLLMVAVVGVGSYFILSDLQDQAQKEQYYAITRKIQSSTMSAILDKQDAITSGITLALEYCPNKEDWPYCDVSFDFYQSMLNPLHRITQTRSISLAVMVKQSEVSTFETFAYKHYEDAGHPELGISPFGKGIFANDANGQRYHDVNGSTLGDYDVLMPVFQVTDYKRNKGVLMYNTYAEKNRMNAIDYSINCARDNGGFIMNCTSTTGIIFLVQDKGVKRPSTLTLLPIIPRNSTMAVGVVSAVHNWDTVLNLASNEKVDGIVAVLSDGESKHAFMYNKGQVKPIESFTPNNKYKDQKVSFSATPFGCPTQYTIEIYPTDEWMEHYKNDVPLVACLLMVFLVVFTSIVFYIYDHLMNREAVHKDLVMQTKRQYVRYISHEIRTPLNVVNLGFQVLFTEMKRLQQRNQAILKPADEVVSTNDTAHIVVDCGSTGSTVNAANPTAETTGNQIADWIDLIHDIIESLNAGIGVLNDLIDYDKIDSGMMTLQKEALSTWSFVDKSVRPFIVQAKAKEINMEMHFHDNTDPENKSKYESLVVLGDRMKLSQVFRNLISNALKFTPAGGAVRMEVRWEEDQDAAKDNSNNKQHKTDKGFSNGRATTNNNTTQFWSRCLTRTKAEKTPLKTSDIHGLEAQYECAGKIVIEVSDSGAGMSEEQVKQLFREGVQFNPNDLQAGQGSGLGLWIAKGIVDSHGGELWASSEGIGKGTTFTLILPVFVQPAVCTPEKKLTKKLSLHDSFYRLISNMEEGRTSSANDGPDIEETTRISSSTSERKSMADQQNSDMDEDAACGIEKLDSDNSEMKQLNSIDLLLESKQSERFRHVLVTDDSAVNRKMMCRSLQSVGFKCFQAADGQECVDIVSKAMRNEHESIDLVLMDYEMPRMNGPTACAALRAMGCGIPVVGVTGNVLNEDKLFFLNHGAVKVIQKPISMADLEDVLRSV